MKKEKTMRWTLFSALSSMMFISSVTSIELFASSDGNNAIERQLPGKKTDPPSLKPTSEPSTSPSDIPTLHPSISPTKHPTISPSLSPSTIYSSIPSSISSSIPSSIKSSKPSEFFSEMPSELLSTKPSESPSTIPSQSLSIMPSSVLSSIPTQYSEKLTTNPTREATYHPTLQPTASPTRLYTAIPSAFLSSSPSSELSISPSIATSNDPTLKPTSRKTLEPTNNPTLESTIDPRRLIFLSASIDTIIQFVPNEMNGYQKDIYKNDVQTFITALFEKTTPPVRNIEVKVGNQILFDENENENNFNPINNRKLQFIQDGIKLYILQVEILVSGEYIYQPQFQNQEVDMKAYIESFFIDHGHVLRDFIKGRHLDYFDEVDKISALPTPQKIKSESFFSTDVFRIVAISIFASLCGKCICQIDVHHIFYYSWIKCIIITESLHIL